MRRRRLRRVLRSRLRCSGGLIPTMKTTDELWREGALINMERAENRLRRAARSWRSAGEELLANTCEDLAARVAESQKKETKHGYAKLQSPR